MSFLKLVEEITVYENPKPAVRSRQAIFPGLTVLPNNELLALFCIGEAFEAANSRCYVTRSSDNGRTWQFQDQLYDQENLGWHYAFSDCYKPTLLDDGSLVAIGYGFERYDSDQGIGTERGFPPGRNVVSFSNDNGKTWTVPEKIDIGKSTLLEISGPAIQLKNKRLLAAGPPFTIDKTGQCGCIITSDDRGKTWKFLSNYFETSSGHIAPWETRICEMQPGRIVAIFWAFDVHKNEHLPNHVSVSHDGGKTFGAPINTGIKAQASNLMWLGGNKLLTIHAHRIGQIGLYIRLVDFSEDQIKVEAEQCIWGKAASQDGSKSIIDQFAGLKFGQPSLVQLQNGEILATFWAMENCMYKIKSFSLL
jgi:sialidase-1